MAYLGFYFRGEGGGIPNNFGKVGVFAGLCIVLHARGSGGMLPRENFKKLCNLVRFGEYLLKFCENKIVKIFIFI